MQYQFKINTPKWFDTALATSRYTWSSLKWIVNPPRCEKCGSRMHTKFNGDIELLNEHGYRKLMISNHGKHWCQSCIAEEVAGVEGMDFCGLSKFDKPKKGKCDCCGSTKKKTWKFYETENIRLHFCINWWNGFWICKDCILETLKNGHVKTSFGKADGLGKIWDVGANGLFLKNGKVQLFKKTRY